MPGFEKKEKAWERATANSQPICHIGEIQTFVVVSQ